MVSKKTYNKIDSERGVDYIGVTVNFFCHDGKGNILLHKRSKNCRDEQDRWDPGGGSMEFGETFEEAVRREIKEEYCADVLELEFITVNNVLRKNGDKNTHWVALIFVAKLNPKQVKIGEQDKMDEIGWFHPKKLPKPLHSKFFEHFDLVLKAKVL